MPPPKAERELALSLFKAAAVDPKAGEEFKAVMAWLEKLRARPSIRAEKISLSEVMRERHRSPKVTDERLQGEVVCVRTVLHEREVKAWTQPLLTSHGKNFCGLILKKEGERFFCLIQAMEEPGIIHGVQLGPSVQTDLSAADLDRNEQPLLSVFGQSQPLLFDAEQSQEGGRFFKDKKRYAAILADQPLAQNLGQRYRWISLGCMKRALWVENTVNIDCRTLLGMLA